MRSAKSAYAETSDLLLASFCRHSDLLRADKRNDKARFTSSGEERLAILSSERRCAKYFFNIDRPSELRDVGGEQTQRAIYTRQCGGEAGGRSDNGRSRTANALGCPQPDQIPGYVGVL